MSISSHSILSGSLDFSEQGDARSYRSYTPNSYEKSEKAELYTEGDIRILKAIDLNSDGMCCQFSNDGEKLAVGLSNGDIKVFQISGECIYHLSDEDIKKSRLPVTSLNFLSSELTNRGDLLIATYANGMIKYWHIVTSTALQTLQESCQLLTSCLSCNYMHFAVAGSSEAIYIYDIASGQKLNTCSASTNRFVMDGHKSRILAVKYHPVDEDVFLSGGWDDTIQIWDQREKHSLRNIFGPHICGDGIDIDEKNGNILSASWRKHEVLEVWDYKMGTKIKTYPSDFSFTSLLYCGQWLGKDRVICGGSDNNMIRIIDKITLATSGMICNLPGGVYSIDHDRHRLAHQKHSRGDVTLIIAVAGKRLYFISNAVSQSRKEELSILK